MYDKWFTKLAEFIVIHIIHLDAFSRVLTTASYHILVVMAQPVQVEGALQELWAYHR